MRKADESNDLADGGLHERTISLTKEIGRAHEDAKASCAQPHQQGAACALMAANVSFGTSQLQFRHHFKNSSARGNNPSATQWKIGCWLSNGSLMLFYSLAHILQTRLLRVAPRRRCVRCATYQGSWNTLASTTSNVHLAHCHGMRSASSGFQSYFQNMLRGLGKGKRPLFVRLVRRGLRPRQLVFPRSVLVRVHRFLAVT